MASAEPAALGRNVSHGPPRSLVARHVGTGRRTFRGMKILWVKSDFLHPTSRGGQIRTLETIRRLHSRHEIHYVAFDNVAEPEGLLRAKEYCSYVYPVRHDAPPKRSL